MTKSTRTRGACVYCGREMTRAGMARHLDDCEQRKKAVMAADARVGADTVLVHLQVQDAWSGDYWLHLEVDGSASLSQLDRYLRAIWLECCGHMSEFSVGGWRGEKVGMTRKVHQAIPPGTELTHIYDFGTESVTLLKAVGRRTGKPTTARPIALMGRNARPSAPCQECGALATHLCVECMIEEDRAGTLCVQHAGSHPHEDYGEPVPLVNSPRTGMCGYTGPAEPPY